MPSRPVWPPARDDAQFHRRTELILRCVADSVDEAVMVADAEGGIHLANAGAERLLGRSSDELQRSRLDRLVDQRELRRRAGAPADADATLDGPTALRVLTAHADRAQRWAFRRADGGLVDVRLTLASLGDDQGVFGWVAAAIEASSDDAAHRLREVNRGLRRRNRELEEFVHTVSHDLKSPLITIGGMIGVLGETIESADQAAIQEIVQRTENTVERMRRILDDLLELSRIGHARFEPAPTGFGNLVRQAVERFRQSLDEQAATVEVPPDLPRVHVDEGRISRLLDNILSNALRHGGGRPRLRICIEALDPQAVRAAGRLVDPHHAVLCIRDNGPGIPAGERERIFGLFIRGEASRDGAGLGLAIVRRIVDVHDGDVWVEEAPGGGAAFIFTLPLARDGEGAERG